MTVNFKRVVFLAAWVIALAVAASVPALALIRGTIWIGPQSYRAQGPLTHPLLALGANVVLPRGSRAMVISVLGSVHVSGTTHDDIAGIDSPIYLQHGAVIGRDLIAVGSTVFRGPGVRLIGRVGGQMSAWAGKGTPGRQDWIQATWQYSRLSFAAGLALLLVCTCISLVLPWQTVLVANRLYSDLPRSLMAGLMGLFLFAFLAVPLGLSLFGLPFALLLSVAAAAAWLLGLTGASLRLGRYLARLRRHEAGLLWAVVSGMFVVGVVTALPWVGPLLVGLAGTAGAGSLALTMIDRARPAETISAVPVEDETFSEMRAYIDRGERLHVD